MHVHNTYSDVVVLSMVMMSESVSIFFIPYKHLKHEIYETNAPYSQYYSPINKSLSKSFHIFTNHLKSSMYRNANLIVLECSSACFLQYLFIYNTGNANHEVR